MKFSVTTKIRHQWRNILTSVTSIGISCLNGCSFSFWWENYYTDQNKIGDMFPDSLNRFIYFKNEGSIEIISKKPSLIFKFHTLPINKFENLPKNNNFIIVNNDLWSNPYRSVNGIEKIAMLVQAKKRIQ